MQDKDRERRRHKRLEKRRKERDGQSRPARLGAVGGGDPEKGAGWPTGECFVTIDWDEDGATEVDAVFSRTKSDGATVIAVFQLDRRGPGLLSARALGGARPDHVTGECARLSEKSGKAMVGCSPGLVAALVDEAVAQGQNRAVPGSAKALALLEGAPRSTVGVPFGPRDAAAPAPPREGLLAGLRRRLLGR